MNKFFPKVLVACPSADIKDYCMEDWIKNVRNFTYPNFDLFMCDNSEKYIFYNKWKHEIAMEHLDPNKFDYFKLCLAKSHDRCRLRALQMGYDYLLHLESDVFPPIDIIESLLSHNKQIAGAMYHIMDGEESMIMIQNIEKEGNVQRDTVNIGRNDISFIDGKLKKVFSLGLGCVLIHKSVLSQIQFRCPPNSPVHPDSFFYSDINKIGISAWVDTSILCEHRNNANYLRV